MDLAVKQEEPGVQTAQMLVIRQRQAILILAAHLEKRRFLVQFEANLLSTVRPLQHMYHNFYAIL